MAESVDGARRLTAGWSPTHSGVCSIVYVVYLGLCTELSSLFPHPLAPPLPLKTSLLRVAPLLHPVEEVLSYS